MGFATAALPQYRRLEWQAFKTTSHYGALLFAIRKMQSNGNAADPNSWAYWTNIHVNRCPHGIPYFLAWHRGYLYYFERQLRAVSGDAGLVLPYWDYYTNPDIPAEFQSPTTGNPLYVARTNVNVAKALTMAPFASSVINFPRNWSNPFEPNLENAPHNPVHDIIGGAMTTMQSPNDPVFWLHHSNIDRLWVAWLAAGGGRNMPLSTNSYWSGSFSYNNTLTMNRILTRDNRASLNYYYQAETMPTRLPGVVVGSSSLTTTEAQPIEQQALQSPPPVGSYALSAPRATSATTFSAAGTQEIELGEASTSIQLPVSAEHSQAMATAASGFAANVAGTTVTYRSVQLVLDNLVMSRLARDGGFFYNVYLNLPAVGPGASFRSKLVGTLGPFRIAGAEHHRGGPVQLRYVITDAIAGLPRAQLGMITVSFVRISGDNSPAGTVIKIGEARIELSADDTGS
jgi:tyrosinase